MAKKYKPVGTVWKPVDDGLSGWAWAGIIFFVLILLGQCSG